MVQFSPAPRENATIKTDILEKYIYALINFGEAHEKNKEKNKDNLNQVTWTATGDDSTFRADLRLPIDVVNASIKGYNYLPYVNFSSDGSKFNGKNWVEETIFAIIELKRLEYSSTANPKKENRVSWSILGEQLFEATSVFVASVIIKTTTEVQPDASIKTEAQEYLD